MPASKARHEISAGRGEIIASHLKAMTSRHYMFPAFIFTLIFVSFFFLDVTLNYILLWTVGVLFNAFCVSANFYNFLSPKSLLGCLNVTTLNRDCKSQSENCDGDWLKPWHVTDTRLRQILVLLFCLTSSPLSHLNGRKTFRHKYLIRMI